MENERKIVLKPDWRSYFWHYLTGVLLLPLFGAGIIILWLTHRKRTSITFEIHDQFIRKRSDGDPFELNLIHIEDISVNQTWIEKRFHIGTVRLAANVSVLELTGMEKPWNLADMIGSAVKSEKKRLYDLKRNRVREPDHTPGTLDKMDYLTGLWQQGLISNEDYEKEKNHFK